MTPSEKHQQFARAYLASGSTRHAAVQAGYAPKTAGTAGARLLKRDDVQALITQHRDAFAAATGGSQIAQAQHADPLDFLVAAMNDLQLPAKLRVQAAVAALPYVHGRLTPKKRASRRPAPPAPLSPATTLQEARAQMNALDRKLGHLFAVPTAAKRPRKKRPVAAEDTDADFVLSTSSAH